MAKDIEIRKSNIEGLGVFALRSFQAGERVIEWKRRELTECEYVELNPDTVKHYVTHKNGKYLLSDETGKRVNHSCDPNTSVRNEADVAIRNITAGEEITSSYTDGVETCNCGSPYCSFK